jgi:hypothetical protein
VVRPGVVLGGRVIGYSGHIDHCVDAGEHSTVDRSHVALDQLDPIPDAVQPVAAEVEAVEKAYGMVLAQELLRQHRSQVPGTANQEHGAHQTRTG